MSSAHYVHRQAVGPNRWQFLLDSMTAMSESYTAVNAKQKLHVVRGPPETLLPLLFKRWKITHLVYEYDPDPYACQRDEEIGSVRPSVMPHLADFSSSRRRRASR